MFEILGYVRDSSFYIVRDTITGELETCVKNYYTIIMLNKFGLILNKQLEWYDNLEWYDDDSEIVNTCPVRLYEPISKYLSNNVNPVLAQLKKESAKRKLLGKEETDWVYNFLQSALGNSVTIEHATFESIIIKFEFHYYACKLVYRLYNDNYYITNNEFKTNKYNKKITKDTIKNSIENSCLMKDYTLCGFRSYALQDDTLREVLDAEYLIVLDDNSVYAKFSDNEIPYIYKLNTGWMSWVSRSKSKQIKFTKEEIELGRKLVRILNKRLG